jgi:hypothetical protein
MIKKLNLGLLIALLSLVVGVGSAYAAALNYTNDTNVVINGRTYVIANGSVATSVVVNATTLVVAVPASGPFTLRSLNGDTLTNDGGVATSCADTMSIVTLTAAATVTFTPTAVQLCTTPAPAGGGSLGGGGGGGGNYDTVAPVALSVNINSGATTTSSLYSTLTLAATDNILVTQMLVSNDPSFAGASWETYAISKAWTLVSGDGIKTVYAKFKDTAGNMSAVVSAFITVSGSGTTPPVTLQISPEVTMTTVTPGCSGGNLYNTSTGQLCNNTVKKLYNFGNTTLKNGSKGEGVKELQRFLNAKLNLGLAVDGKLGPKTIAVMKKWQKDHGLVVDGLIGPKTKAMMNSEAE